MECDYTYLDHNSLVSQKQKIGHRVRIIMGLL
jgi:hypothetical protein